MKKPTLWVSLCLAAVFLAGDLFAQAKSLKIGTATGKSATVPITATSDEDVQGFVVAVAFDAAKVEATDVNAAGATLTNNAELVVGEVLTGGFTIGVVMDFNTPYDGQTIPDGTDVLIAEADLVAKAIVACGSSEAVPLTLTDGLNDPPLNNILVVGGLSIGQTEGLGLNHGSLTIPGTCDTVRIVSAAGAAGDASVPVTIEVDNQRPVEGYILSIEHDPGVTLASIETAGTDAADVTPDGIEFQVPRIYPEGGTLGVVFDFNPPYLGQVLDPGTSSIAVFTYSYATFNCPAADKTFGLRFIDGRFGSPPLDNTLVEGGFSFTPDKENGSVTFKCKPASEITYYLGGDMAPGATEIPCATIPIGDVGKVVFYYTSAVDPIQGMSMAVKFASPLEVVDLEASGQGDVQAKHTDGTITKGINAEFVSFNADNVAGELIIGILVDSTPPIPVNHMYPPTDIPGKVINIFFSLPALPCEQIGDSLAVGFNDSGLTGAGDVAIYNRAAVFNESKPVNYDNSGGGAWGGGCVVIGKETKFIRGDCNSDAKVDIADPAATMSYLFLGYFVPPCMDACDSNDDEMVDLADVATTLRFLFKLGPILKPPYPIAGYDPPNDDPNGSNNPWGELLDCDAGSGCP